MNKRSKAMGKAKSLKKLEYAYDNMNSETKRGASMRRRMDSLRGHLGKPKQGGYNGFSSK